MAVIKCKMCGGDLNFESGSGIAQCEYCGSVQTIPVVHNDMLENLFNRANLLRRKSEFDKAEQIYEKIVLNDAHQAEAYWGLILCKFGIEYVEDPATCKRVPTCHRTLPDSIISDADYKTALEKADPDQRRLYEAEAREIDRLQKEIIALSQKESPYDVFICYKQTDEAGKRTADSVIGNEIYHQLTQEGLKVFYAAISLEDKLGSAYEPCIFAALSSAKVMLVIGTKPEYFNAVWVRNEWSRFLRMMKTDRSKLLIPCYKDMDPYELPEEFAHLQAQDMSKIGFINDVIRGIRKIAEHPKAAKETVVTRSVNSPLLERAFMFLEDGDYARADEFFEQVLNLEPKNAQAYLGKLMAELHVRKRESLKDCEKPFDHSEYYEKTLRFADENLKKELTECIAYINMRNEMIHRVGIYAHARQTMAKANTARNYREAAWLFESIEGYEDAAELAKECHEKADVEDKDDLLEKAKAQMPSEIVVNYDAAIQDYEEMIQIYASIPGWKDADAQKALCEQKIKEIKSLKEAAAQQAEKKAERNFKLQLIGFLVFLALGIVYVILGSK